ncbi:MAG: hypothetical protein ACO27H_07745 [Burkholderiaceae bacterium]|jgi:hypothetical protein
MTRSIPGRLSESIEAAVGPLHAALREQITRHRVPGASIAVWQDGEAAAASGGRAG